MHRSRTTAYNIPPNSATELLVRLEHTSKYADRICVYAKDFSGETGPVSREFAVCWSEKNDFRKRSAARLMELQLYVNIQKLES